MGKVTTDVELQSILAEVKASKGIVDKPKKVVTRKEKVDKLSKASSNLEIREEIDNLLQHKLLVSEELLGIDRALRDLVTSTKEKDIYRAYTENDRTISWYTQKAIKYNNQKVEYYINRIHTLNNPNEVTEGEW